MAHVFLRHNRYSARVRVPKGAQHLHSGNQIVERSLRTSDKKVAHAEAAAWEAELRLKWAAEMGKPEPGTYRSAYLLSRQRASAGEYQVHARNADPITLGIEHEIDAIADRIGENAIQPADAARLAGLGDALAEHQGQPAVVPPEYEAPFSTVTDDFMAQWKRQQGLKETNTEQQKRATLRLFQGFWKDRPLRGIKERDATEFADIVRALNPAWARSAAARALPWGALIQAHGNHPTGLGASTMNRHMAALATFWTWARKRGHCSGDNPFEGHHQRLTATNTAGYLPWEPDELKRLLAPPPPRTDLAEIIRVALFSGMRLNEIASLTWGRVRTDEGIDYFQIDDAKTPAGVRQVPVHPALGWLVARREDKKADERLWPTFNPEGPGAKPGADAGREFSRFKASRGFTSRRKAFHSFRKNVTRIMERAGVPENEWAQVFGHERGFTYGVYNPDGITLARKAEIIALIDYKGVVDTAEPMSEKAA